MTVASPPSTSTKSMRIRLPDPHPGQIAFFRNRKRFNWLNTGRRWRKTTGMMDLTVDDMLQGKQCFWGAPTFDQVRLGWTELKKATIGVFQFNHSHMIATAPTGGRCVFRSLDNPDNARGHTADAIRLDETADIDPAAWYEVLRPMLIDTHGTLDAAGTPKGRNWFHDEWWKAKIGESANSAAFQAPTYGVKIEQGRLVRAPHPMENPFIDFEEMEQVFRATPERIFRQEYLAEFLESAGGVFENVRSCVGGVLEMGPSHPQRRYAMGVDLAKNYDYTVCVVMDVIDRRVVYFKRWNSQPYDIQKQQIYLIAQHWNNAEIQLDSTSGSVGDPIFDDLQRSGLHVNPFRFTYQSKNSLINNAVLMIEQQQVKIPAACDILLEELGSYEYRVTPLGNYLTNAPVGKHDDCVIAFALACWCIGQMPQTPTSAWFDEVAEMSNGTTFGGADLLGRRF